MLPGFYWLPKRQTHWTFACEVVNFHRAEFSPAPANAAKVSKSVTDFTESRDTPNAPNFNEDTYPAKFHNSIASVQEQLRQVAAHLTGYLVQISAVFYLTNIIISAPKAIRAEQKVALAGQHNKFNAISAVYPPIYWNFAYIDASYFPLQ